MSGFARSVRRSILAAAFLFMAHGCAGDDDVTGYWLGTWRDRGGLVDGDFELALTQDADGGVVGEAILTGELCVLDGEFEGTLDRRHLEGMVVGEDGEVELSGRLEVGDDRIDGSWEVIVGECAGDKGSFTLKR